MTWALLAVGIGAALGFAMLVMAIRNAMREGESRCANSTGALRCSICAVDWPLDIDQYGNCPMCLLPTDAIVGTGVEPLDPREARSIRLHHDFERFYAARHGSAQV